MTKPQANSKRPEKLSAIAEIDEFVKNSGYCFVLNYGGLNVEQLAALRVELGKAKSTLKVVKNTYLAKALEDKGWTQLESVLSGPTALVAGDGDPAEVAKAIVAFLKKNEQASVKAGQLESQTLDAPSTPPPRTWSASSRPRCGASSTCSRLASTRRAAARPSGRARALLLLEAGARGSESGLVRGISPENRQRTEPINPETILTGFAPARSVKKPIHKTGTTGAASAAKRRSGSIRAKGPEGWTNKTGRQRK